MLHSKGTKDHLYHYYILVKTGKNYVYGIILSRTGLKQQKQSLWRDVLSSPSFIK